MNITLPAAGQRIGRVCGPGEFPSDDAGIVIAHAWDSWGSYAVVLMDGGRIEHCHCTTDRGIGWHVINQPE